MGERRVLDLETQREFSEVEGMGVNGDCQGYAEA